MGSSRGKKVWGGGRAEDGSGGGRGKEFHKNKM